MWASLREDGSPAPEAEAPALVGACFRIVVQSPEVGARMVFSAARGQSWWRRKGCGMRPGLGSARSARPTGP